MNFSISYALIISNMQAHITHIKHHHTVLSGLVHAHTQCCHTWSTQLYNCSCGNQALPSIDLCACLSIFMAKPLEKNGTSMFGGCASWLMALQLTNSVEICKAFFNFKKHFMKYHKLAGFKSFCHIFSIFVLGRTGSNWWCLNLGWNHYALNINILNVKLTQLKKENPLKPSTSMTLTLKNILIFQGVW